MKLELVACTRHVGNQEGRQQARGKRSSKHKHPETEIDYLPECFVQHFRLGWSEQLRT